MAISQPTKSLQYSAVSASPFPTGRAVDTGNPLFEVVGTLPFIAAGFTSAGAGDLSILRLPPGRLRVRLDLSRVTCPAGTATSDLDIGFAEYVKPDGTTQTLQGAVLADSLDVGGGALNQNLSAGAVSVVDSRDGVDVVASFDTANSPASGLLVLTIVYQRDDALRLP